MNSESDEERRKLSVSHGQDRDDAQSRSLFSVWPTELRQEWRQRTRYGKLWYLAMLPQYVVEWAVILLFVAIMAFGYYGIVLACRVAWRISSWLPATHRGENDA